MTPIALETKGIIGERWPVYPFQGQMDDPRFRNHVVVYRVAFEYPGYQIAEHQNLTVITLSHSFLYGGTEAQLGEWGRREGGPVIANYIVDIVNRLVDLVQATFKQTDTNPFPHIRHVGVRDFLLLDVLCGPKRQNLISYAMPALDARMAKHSIGLVSMVNFSTVDEPPKDKIKMLRAVELLNSGYRTEAVLVAFAVLDKVVQETLITLMEERGIKEAKVVLQVIPANRLKNYLGAVLRMLTGRSLQDDNTELWKRLGELNDHRNKAIHEAIDLSWNDAVAGIETVRDILLYLSSVKRAGLQEVDETVLKRLDIDRLPILLQDT